MARLQVATCTDIGARRRNEDSLQQQIGHGGVVLVVADGAGGHAGGDEASMIATSAVAQTLHDPGAPFEPSTLTAALLRAHAQLRGQASGTAHTLDRMHTTVVALWIDTAEQLAMWSHVGDSRLYRFRLGKGEQLTEDDSVVAQLVRHGLLTEADAKSHPYKGQLMAALGGDGELRPHTVARPVRIMDGDAYLLCTDGWWEHFAIQELEARLLRAVSPEDWLSGMAAAIRVMGKPDQDNFSAVAVWAGEPEASDFQEADETVAPPT